MEDAIIEFSEMNRVNGFFVKDVIEVANGIPENGPLFPSMVLSAIGKKQKESITKDVDQMMKNSEAIAEEYNAPATESDFERVPAKFRSRFPTNTKDWKNKDIAIYTRWLMYFDQVAQTPLLPIVDKILKTFNLWKTQTQL